MTNEQEIASGAKRVEETEHMQANLETPGDLAIGERNIAEHLTAGKSDTKLGEATLGMFQKGNLVQVRVGSATNSSELYEGTFESADEANTALLDADILKASQVADLSQLAGTGIKISGLSSQQLENAGLKRRVNTTL